MVKCLFYFKLYIKGYFIYLAFGPLKVALAGEKNTIT